MKRLLVLCILMTFVVLSLSAQEGDWLWANKAGGTLDDYGQSIAVDSEGNSYVTGYFMGTATFGSITLTSSGSNDIFIAKIDNNGNWLWANRAGGSSQDKGNGIAVDSEGNSYVTGYFNDTATFGSTTLTSSGDDDIFIAKADKDGNWLWAIQAGGENNDCGEDIAVDSEGNCYVTGSFEYQATFGSTTLTSEDWYDFFIAKVDKDGNWLWVKQAGASSTGGGYGVALDSQGNCYVTGYFNDTATFGDTKLQSYSGSFTDIFIAKADKDGNWLWAERAGGSSNDQGNGIAIDSEGNCYVTGFFQNKATFGEQLELDSSGWDADIFIAKLDTDGVWSWVIHPKYSYIAFAQSITIDSADNCYVTGNFREIISFIDETLVLETDGNADIFIVKVDPNGDWLWAKQAGGSDDEYGNGIAVDSAGNCYVIGVFFDEATFGELPELEGSGVTDIFIAKLGLDQQIGLPVELSAFNVNQLSNDGIELCWVTGSETNLLGYNIYRSEDTSLNNAEKLNSAIIPGCNTSIGNSYKYEDASVELEKEYFYWLESVELDFTNKFFGPISIYVRDMTEGGSGVNLPPVTRLIGAYPNPFNPSTNIYFTLNKDQRVTIDIYNSKGQLVENICTDKYFDKGSNSVTWSGANLGSGIYYISLRTDFASLQKKMLLLK